MTTPRLIFDHDARHPLIYMYEPPIQNEEVQVAVDELTGTPVDALSLTLGDVRSLLYASRAGEMWGQGVRHWPHVIWRRAHQNFAHLHGTGPDALDQLCARAHEKGLLIYGSLLVQQGPRERMLKSWENVGFGEDDWRYDLQPFDIGAHGDVDRDWPGYRCPDFGRGEVRDVAFAVIQEALSNYPLDGLELHLSYTPYYFHPNKVGVGRGLMTEWIERVHERVKCGNSRRALVVRVPVDVDGCKEVGLEPLEWIRRGIVDAVVPEASMVADPTMDIGHFIKATEGSGCRILPAIHDLVDSDRIGQATIEMMRAVACNYWAQGAHGLYLAHWFGGWPYSADFYEKLREIGDAEVMAPKDKIYRLPTRGNAPARQDVAPHTVLALPAELTIDSPVYLEWPVSDALQYWRDKGRAHAVILRVRIEGTTELDRMRFLLNGRILPGRSLRRINQMFRMNAPRYRVFGYWFVYRLEPEDWPIMGQNILQIDLLERDREVRATVSVRDVELQIQYLLGKHFDRGFLDHDLGPCERSLQPI